MITTKKIAYAVMVLLSGAGWAAHGESIGALNSKEPSAQTVYECQKTDEKITVDGVLDEDVWRTTPSMPCVDITDGSRPPFLTDVKMIWDNKYLYAGFYFEEPDIRACWGLEEPNCPEWLMNSLPQYYKGGKKGRWDYAECSIMRIDRFAKLFLDPDGDGVNYLEFQINPLNCVFDSWYKQGFTAGKTGNRERYPNVEWKCPLLSGTKIYGTVNAPHDVDKGWSLEIAIPWTALAPFTKGACPPKSGDVWGGHVGRVYRDRAGGQNEYWVWPFLGVRNCHLPDRYGKVVFKDELRKFERFFAWGAIREDAEYVRRLKQLGITDLIGGKPSDKAVGLFTDADINLYTVIYPNAGGDWEKKHPGVPPPLQKMTAEEEAACELLNGNVSSHRPAADPDSPADWSVSEDQKKLLDKLAKSNYRQQSKYQWGGEPEGKHFGGGNTEVLYSMKLLCPNNSEVKELMRDRIKDALSVPGVRGVAFDFFGYQNYHACYCPLCEKLFAKYCEKTKVEAANPKSRDAFSLAALVDFNNELADYAKSLRPDAVVVNHVYPAFTPEPLYGNRLKVDFCGQTAAWYQYWDLWRVEKYSRMIVNAQEKYWQGSKGVAFIGYYDRPEFPVKTPAKVEAELRAILRGGATRLMMCGLDDLLRNHDVCEVFQKFCSSGKESVRKTEKGHQR